MGTVCLSCLKTKAVCCHIEAHDILLNPALYEESTNMRENFYIRVQNISFLMIGLFSRQSELHGRNFFIPFLKAVLSSFLSLSHYSLKLYTWLDRSSSHSKMC